MLLLFTGLRENEDFVAVITSVRSVCDDFSENTDVRAYPSGYPFLFWQQYIDLRYWLFVALASVVAAIFVVIAAILVNIAAAFITVSFSKSFCALMPDHSDCHFFYLTQLASTISNIKLNTL